MKKALSVMMALALLLALCLPAVAQRPLTVVTSFYPLHIFAQNVLKGVEGVQLLNLTHPTTGCLHDYQLLASDMRTLADADAIVINGGGMEPFLDVLAQQFPHIPVIDSSQGIELIAEEDLLDAEDDMPKNTTRKSMTTTMGNLTRTSGWIRSTPPAWWKTWPRGLRRCFPGRRS